MVHVVDDDVSMRTSLARLLGGAGYVVTLYAAAEELLDAASAGLSGCILLDLRLPGQAGSRCRIASLSAGASSPSSSSRRTAT